MPETLPQSLFPYLPYTETAKARREQKSHTDRPAEHSTPAQTARFRGLLVRADERRPSLGTLSRTESVEKDAIVTRLRAFFVLQLSALKFFACHFSPAGR